MATVPRRSNSTNPRPGSSAFPKVPRSSLVPQPLDIKRSNTTAGAGSSREPQQSRSTPYSSSTRERIDPRAPLSPIPSSAGSRSTPYSSAHRERTDLRSTAALRPLQTAHALNRRPSNAAEATGHRRRPSLGGESIGQFASSRRPPGPEHARRPSASNDQQNTPPRQPSVPTHTRRPSGPIYQPQPQSQSQQHTRRPPGPTYQPQPQSQSHQHTRRPSAAHRQHQHARRPSAPGAGGGGRPQITQQVDQATKTQINQTYAVTMMASPYNPLPFFLPIPLGIATLLTPSGKDRNQGAAGTGGGGPAPMRAGKVGGRR